LLAKRALRLASAFRDLIAGKPRSYRGGYAQARKLASLL